MANLMLSEFYLKFFFFKIFLKKKVPGLLQENKTDQKHLLCFKHIKNESWITEAESENELALTHRKWTNKN